MVFKNSYKISQFLHRFFYLNKCCFVIIPAMLINTLADYSIQIFQLKNIVFLTLFNSSLQEILKENMSVYIQKIIYLEIF